MQVLAGSNKKTVSKLHQRCDEENNDESENKSDIRCLTLLDHVNMH